MASLSLFVSHRKLKIINDFPIKVSLISSEARAVLSRFSYVHNWVETQLFPLCYIDLNSSHFMVQVSYSYSVNTLVSWLQEIGTMQLKLLFFFSKQPIQSLHNQFSLHLFISHEHLILLNSKRTWIIWFFSWGSKCLHKPVVLSSWRWSIGS